MHCVTQRSGCQSLLAQLLEATSLAVLWLESIERRDTAVVLAKFPRLRPVLAWPAPMCLSVVCLPQVSEWGGQYHKVG